MRKIIIGSRGSELALWQANHVKGLLEALDVQVEIKIIKTQGDVFFNLNIQKLEGKGFFTKELEEELLKGSIDLAVHSFKDLPTQGPLGLTIGAVPARENPADLLLIRPDSVDIKKTFSLVQNAIVGTSSPRRKSQMLAHRLDLQLIDLRGNVPTRLQKLRDGDFDAILVAKAGINRLNLDLSDFHVENVSATEIIPAPAQGALALQIRVNDRQLEEKLAFINDPDAVIVTSIERDILSLFGGGCQSPMGIYCRKEKNIFQVWTCKSDSFEDFPDRLFMTSEKSEGLAEKVVAQFNGVKDRVSSVFISRELNQGGYLQTYLEKKGVSLEGRSLIRTFPIIHKLDSSILSRVDWVFFYSKNAVEYFFALKPKTNTAVKFGVVGRGSEAALRQLGLEASFVGEASDTSMVARKFAKLTIGKTVLFPQAKDSLRSIQNGLSAETIAIDLPIYETEADENSFYSDAQVLIFTSPSNVSSYIERNLIELNQKVIAIGKSTGSKLEEYNVNNFLTPYSPDELGLAEAVFSLM